jgi:hypothetical protein
MSGYLAAHRHVDYLTGYRHDVQHEVRRAGQVAA